VTEMEEGRLNLNGEAHVCKVKDIVNNQVKAMQNSRKRTASSKPPKGSAKCTVHSTLAV